jgi:hypothetical protein
MVHVPDEYNKSEADCDHQHRQGKGYAEEDLLKTIHLPIGNGHKNHLRSHFQDRRTPDLGQ